MLKGKPALKEVINILPDDVEIAGFRDEQLDEITILFRAESQGVFPRTLCIKNVLQMVPSPIAK